MKKIKRGIAIVLSLALAATACIGVTAQAPSFKYVGLGDSISEGYGVGVEKSHVNIIGENLKATGTEKGYDVVYYNKAHSGDTSQDLLNKVKSKAFEDILTNADIVTISIGGNDIMQFLAREIAIALGINPDAGDVFKQVIAAVTANPQGCLQPLMARIASEDFKNNKQAMLDKCIANVKNTAAKIKELAPNSKIYLMTIYDVANDYASGAKESPADMKLLVTMVRSLLNSVAIKPINELYVNNAADLYTVADVFTAYQNDTTKQSLLLMDLFAASPVVDPHPTVYGQQVIASCFEKVIGEVFTEEVIELGNIQNRGISVSSALLALQHSVNLVTLEGRDFIAGDVDLDKAVTIKDALQILQYSVGLIHEFIPASNIK